ncbi:MAG TPA: transposase [Anaerolineales bacterium]|nr:transposase [Anaerolineales bacterium]
MRLNLILPKVEPTEFEFPKKCPRPGCRGMRFIPRQEVSKKIVDAQHPEVTAWRCECKQCGHVFRVYPKGVNQKHISKRVNGMAVMMYLLGLSYGAVEIVLNSLGMGIGKTSVYRAVQAVTQQVPGLKREQLLSGYKTKAVGADVTSVRCNGQWVTIGIVVDAVNGPVLSIDELPGEDAEQLQAWLEPILDAVDADVVVSDDADAFKNVSDKTGRSQQVCKSHVVRNTEALVAELSATISTGQDHSLEAIQVTPEQALEDLAALQEMIHSRRPEDQPRLETIYLRYANARKPGQGKKHDLAYRMRNLFMDRWNLWPRLTFYRTWKDENENEILDGTNNHCERAIGWWIKERYRSMRGYKQKPSALGISRLTAWAGNHLVGGLHLADLMA